MLEVVSFEETREMEEERDPSGIVLELNPIEGSEKAFLHLRLPSQAVIRVEVPFPVLDEIVPLLL